MEVTSKQVLELLEQSGRHRFTEHQLVDLRSKQLLPPLQRRNLPGSRKAVYLWDEGVVAQAAYLHDILQWDRQHDRLYLPLWLAGYDISLRAVQRLHLRFIERHLMLLTGGETDTEEILDKVSTLVFEYWLPKWKYSPKKHQIIRQFGVDAWAELVECVFDCLATPDYEPDPELLLNLCFHLIRFAEAQRAPGQESTTLALDNHEQLSRTTEALHHLVRQVTPIISISTLKTAVEQATPEEWEQARVYYQELSAAADFLYRPLNACLPEPLDEVFYYKTKMNSALCCIPVFLSLIRQKFHDVIDSVLSKGARPLLAFLKQHGWSELHPKEVLLKIGETLRQQQERQNEAGMGKALLAG